MAQGKNLPKSQIEREAKRIADLTGQDDIPVLFSEHHLSHAGAAFYPSPLKTQLFSAWMACEWATTSAWVGSSNQLNYFGKFPFPSRPALFRIHVLLRLQGEFWRIQIDGTCPLRQSHLRRNN